MPGLRLHGGHDVRPDDGDSVDDWRDAEWRYLHESAEKFNAGQKELVAVPAIENTWYDGTGHINVFDGRGRHGSFGCAFHSA
ncbi:hypothetical protein AB0O28_20825 [Microbispora sp. NPDC088329]|uniref:hypothetical protein n=1 Tax=Microbispora sp. NPDC088329 TaxID=3154869 RepID=UPI00343AC85E